MTSVSEADIEVDGAVVASKWTVEANKLQEDDDGLQRPCILWSKARNEALVKRSIREQQNEAEETKAQRRLELQKMEEARLARAKLQRAKEKEDQIEKDRLALQQQRELARSKRQTAKRTFHFDHAF